MATPKGLAKRSDRPQRGIGARRPLAQASAGGQRRLFREAALPDGPARSLQGELCARLTNPGPLATERRDGDDDQGRVLGPEGTSVHGLVADEDVGRGQQVPSVTLNRALRRVHVFEEST